MQRIIIILYFLICSLLSFSQVEWGYSVGGLGWEKPLDISTDKDNNVYTVGRYSGEIDFDPSQNVFLDSTSTTDVYIQKMSPSKKHIWTKFIKGVSLTQEISIICDNDHLYLTGEFSKTADFDPGPEEAIIESAYYGDIILLKLTLSGNFVWVKSLEGNGYNGHGSTGISQDGDGNIYITGYYSCPIDFDTGSGEHFVEMHPTQDISTADGFISKFSSDGELVWVSTFNGKSSEFGTSIVTDDAGFSYISGKFRDTTNFTSETDTLVLVGASSYTSEFLAKYDPEGNPVWVQMLEETNYPNMDDLALSEDGYLFMLGYYYGGGGSYIRKFSQDGIIIWDKRVNAFGYSMSLDTDQNVYVVGCFKGSKDFDPGLDTFEITTSLISDQDVFLLKLDSAGAFVWATSIAGPDDQGETYITTSTDGHIYMTAESRGQAMFDPVFWSESLLSNGSSDVIVLKIHPDLNGEKIEDCDEFILYPNPATDILFIHNHFGNQMEVEVYDALGNIVYLNNDKLTAVNLDMSAFAQGLYMVEIKSSFCHKKLKVIKN